MAKRTGVHACMSMHACSRSPPLLLPSLQPSSQHAINLQLTIKTGLPLRRRQGRGVHGQDLGGHHSLEQGPQGRARHALPRVEGRCRFLSLGVCLLGLRGVVEGLSVAQLPSTIRRTPNSTDAQQQTRPNNQKQVFGEEYLSWVWVRRPYFIQSHPSSFPHLLTPHPPRQQVDTGAAATTTEAVKLAAAVGTPVRSAGPGYNMPTFFRIAVREPGVTKVCMWVWMML